MNFDLSFHDLIRWNTMMKIAGDLLLGEIVIWTLIDFFPFLCSVRFVSAANVCRIRPDHQVPDRRSASFPGTCRVSISASSYSWSSSPTLAYSTIPAVSTTWTSISTWIQISTWTAVSSIVIGNAIRILILTEILPYFQGCLDQRAWPNSCFCRTPKSSVFALTVAATVSSSPGFRLFEIPTIASVCALLSSALPWPFSCDSASSCSQWTVPCSSSGPISLGIRIGPLPDPSAFDWRPSPGPPFFSFAKAKAAECGAIEVEISNFYDAVIMAGFGLEAEVVQALLSLT